MLVRGEFVSNFQDKLIILKPSLVNKILMVPLDSSIPQSIYFVTKKSLKTIVIAEQVISKWLIDWNPNRAHGHDGLSIH